MRRVTCLFFNFGPRRPVFGMSEARVSHAEWVGLCGTLCRRSFVDVDVYAVCRISYCSIRYVAEGIYVPSGFFTFKPQADCPLSDPRCLLQPRNGPILAFALVGHIPSICSAKSWMLFLLRQLSREPVFACCKPIIQQAKTGSWENYFYGHI